MRRLIAIAALALKGAVVWAMLAPIHEGSCAPAGDKVKCAAHASGKLPIGWRRLVWRVKNVVPALP